MSTEVARHELLLPWESSLLEDRRYRSILRIFLLALLALGVVLPLIPVPEPDRQQQEAMPPQLAKILIEKKELPKPPPAVTKPEPKKVVEKPVVTPKKQVNSQPRTADKVEKAKQKAALSGLLQFQDELAEMRDQLDMEELASAGLSKGEASAAEVDRTILGNRSAKTSGGIDTAALGQETGGEKLSGRQTTRVESELAAAVVAAQSVTTAGRSRSDEDIRKIMDRNKGAIFSIYNRALRKDPLLSGKVTVQLVIEPSGQVSDVKILASELADVGLEQKLLARIRMIMFGEDSVVSTMLNYSFDFLPY